MFLVPPARCAEPPTDLPRWWQVANLGHNLLHRCSGEASGEGMEPWQHSTGGPEIGEAVAGRTGAGHGGGKTNGLNTNGLNTNGLNTNGLKTNGLNTNGLKTNGLKTNGLKTNGLNTNGLNTPAMAQVRKPGSVVSSGSQGQGPRNGGGGKSGPAFVG